MRHSIKFCPGFYIIKPVMILLLNIIDWQKILTCVVYAWSCKWWIDYNICIRFGKYYDRNLEKFSRNCGIKSLQLFYLGFSDRSRLCNKSLWLTYNTDKNHSFLRWQEKKQYALIFINKIFLVLLFLLLLFLNLPWIFY